MENPFVYGEVVPAASFVDRIDELDRLVRDLASGQKVFLISPRRYGKSSLIRQALRAVGRGGALTAEITVSSYSSYLAFLEGYTRSLLAMQSGWDKARSWLKDAIGAAKPELRLEADSTGTHGHVGEVSRASGPTATSRAWRPRSSRCPAGSARLRKTRIVVALDEFQAINGFNGGSVEHAHARGRPASAQRRVRLRRVRAQPDGADARAEAAVLQSRAGDAAGEDSAGSSSRPSSSRDSRRPASSPKPGLGAVIVDLAGNMPYDVQRLAHESWDDARAAGKRRIGVDDLHADAAPAAGRAGHDVRGGLAAPDAGAARHAARRRAGGRTRAALGRPARPLPPRRRVDGADRAAGAGPRGSRRARRRSAMSSSTR